MKLDFHTIDTRESTGYGKAGASLYKALSDENIHFTDNANTTLNFCMPNSYKWSKHTIGYTPWESTSIPENWFYGMDHVDDLWSTSKWSASIIKNIIGRDVFILPHGLGDIWQPIKHSRELKKDKFTFLHVGGEAVRKGGDIVLEAWYKAFQHRSDCRLIYKCVDIPVARVKDKKGSIVASPHSFQNVEVINTIYSELELYHLYSQVDCLVYPTRGEGFGFIPLEAISSGLPTILPAMGATGEFCHFGIPIRNSIYVDSREAEHPGSWLHHDIDELIDVMEDIVDNYDIYAEWQYKYAFKARALYEWSDIARRAYDRITTKFG